MLLIKCIQFFNRIFDMVKEIYSGVIFSLLPINAFVVGLTLYNLEHVRIIIKSAKIEKAKYSQKKIISFNWIFIFPLATIQSDLDLFFVNLLSFFAFLAIFYMLFCNQNNRSSCSNGTKCLRLWLVWFGAKASEIHDSDYVAFARSSEL